MPILPSAREDRRYVKSSRSIRQDRAPANCLVARASHHERKDLALPFGRPQRGGAGAQIWTRRRCRSGIGRTRSAGISAAVDATREHQVERAAHDSRRADLGMKPTAPDRAPSTSRAHGKRRRPPARISSSCTEFLRHRPSIAIRRFRSSGASSTSPCCSSSSFAALHRSPMPRGSPSSGL